MKIESSTGMACHQAKRVRQGRDQASENHDRWKPRLGRPGKQSGTAWSQKATAPNPKLAAHCGQADRSPSAALTMYKRNLSTYPRGKARDDPGLLILPKCRFRSRTR